MSRESLALKERRESLLRSAAELTSKPSPTKADIAKSSAMLAEAAMLRDREQMAARAAEVFSQETGIELPELMTPEQRVAYMESQEIRGYIGRGEKPERRTYAGMSIATDSQGGYFVPQSTFDRIITAMKQADGLWDDSVITMYNDSHGNQLVCPLVDDTAAVAVEISENASSNEVEPGVIDQLLLGKIPTWRSQKIITSVELLQDSAFPIEGIVNTAIADRFRRGISAANVVTLISSTTSGATSASATAVTLDDCLSLLGSLNPAYVASPRFFWGMNFATLISLLKLKGTDGLYVWKPRQDANGRLLLFEKPVVLMPSLQNIGASNKPIVAGDFSRCLRRVVGGIRLMRYTQSVNLAEFGLVAFEGFLRTSFGVLASASSDSPIKFLTCAAS